MERQLHVTHIHEWVKSTFHDFTARLEEALGRLDEKTMKSIREDPKSAEESLRYMGGLENLFLYHIEDHGGQLALRGETKKAKVFVIGHPLISTEMTAIDIRAGLYHPLRLLVYVGEDDRTYVEYDQPSSLFSQFNRNGVTQESEMLDLKLKNLIDLIDRNEKFRLSDQVF